MGETALMACVEPITTLKTLMGNYSLFLGSFAELSTTPKLHMSIIKSLPCTFPVIHCPQNICIPVPFFPLSSASHPSEPFLSHAFDLLTSGSAGFHLADRGQLEAHKGPTCLLHRGA